MTVKLVWALKIAPQDDLEGVHELGLGWYRFEDEKGHSDQSLHQAARPAVWVKFNHSEQLERIQNAFPEAKLGPAASFTEALIFAESWDTGKTLEKKVHLLLEGEKEGDDMEAFFREDTMEDY
ncbi:MAG: hypothetical protein ACHQYP_03035 [Nitrospiria bacterium]